MPPHRCTPGPGRKPQFIAATATIRAPETHLEKLTGAPFSVIEEEHNGAPRHPSNLYHLATEPRGGSAEDQVAKLVMDIIRADPNAQVIAFHDSRMGVERIVQRINQPQVVLPYRSGYLAEDRRNIEDRLRSNSIRGIIATSALELGIDMPDLNYGINLDLPPSRKQFHQRLGRVGRSKPGSFVILTPATRFSSFGETLREYYENSVEPSHLYLENEYINYQQALCLKDELERSSVDTRTLPGHTVWPGGFEEALKNAHGRPPAHLRPLHSNGDTPPQIANNLRSSGEETLQIITARDEGERKVIGHINIQSALEEAHPGAVYRHRGASYRVETWGRDRETRTPFIRVREMDSHRTRTKPLMRRVITIPQDPACIIQQQEMETGSLTELRVVVTESVEGYEDSEDGPVLYQTMSAKDPRLSRKQREMPTIAVQLRINEPWFRGEMGPPWQARHQIASALRLHLAYQKSIALPDLRYQAENITMETPQGFVELQDSILIHDNIHGGMGLVEDLYDNISRYAGNLKMGDNNEPGTVYPEYARSLTNWLERGSPGGWNDQQARPPGPEDWWRVIRTGSRIRVFSRQQEDQVAGTVEQHLWQDGIVYLVGTGEETIEARDNQVSQAEIPPDWQLWQPGSGRLQELQIGR